MKYKILIIMLFLMPNLIYAEDAELSAMQFLRISPSPRASALGNSYISVYGNSDTIFYNPALISFHENMQFSLAYAKWFQDMHYACFSSTFSIGRAGVIGIGITSMLYGDIIETTDTGSDYNITGRNINPCDYNFMGSYGHSIGKKIGIGISLKGAIEHLADDTISALVLDAGIIYKEWKRNWAVGFVVQNAGIPVKKADHKFKLPMNFKLGGSYELNILKKAKPKMHKIMITGDIGKGLDYDYLLSCGLEYGFAEMIFIRSGYQYQGDEPGFKAGLGLRYKKLDIDYAYVLIKYLGCIHKIGITYKIKQKDTMKKQEEPTIIKNETDRGVELIINDILFKYNSAKLKSKKMDSLNEAIEIIKEYRDIDIIIEGYTDSTGTKGYNLKLSRNRARSVYNYFIKKGINPKNLFFCGFGETRPIASNLTKEGRKRNRRVYIILVKKLTKKEEEKFEYYFFNGLDCYYKEGYKLAIKEWRKALKLKPDDKKVMYWIKKAKKKIKLKK